MRSGSETILSIMLFLNEDSILSIFIKQTLNSEHRAEEKEWQGNDKTRP